MEFNVLESIGFTRGEIKVYFALLELGGSTSGPIIKRSNVARSKVYDILEKLKKKGLVTETIKENAKFFQAVSPKRILDFIKSKEIQLEKDAKQFRNVLPEIMKKYKTQTEKKEVRIYESFEGFKTFYKEVLQLLGEDDEYLAMTFNSDVADKDSLALFFRKFHEKRAAKRIKAKILCNSGDKITRSTMNFSDTGLYNFRLTSAIFPTGISITKDIVATSIWGKTPIVFAINCRENAEHYRKFFYHLWKKSRPLKRVF